MQNSCLLKCVGAQFSAKYFVKSRRPCATWGATPTSHTLHIQPNPTHSIWFPINKNLALFLLMLCVTWQNKSIKGSCRRAGKLHGNIRCQYIDRYRYMYIYLYETRPTRCRARQLRQKLRRQMQIASKFCFVSFCGETLKANYLTCDIMHEFLPWGPSN